MALSYTIEVRNESGAKCEYYIFPETPEISPRTKIWSNIIREAKVDNRGTVEFKINKQNYAVVGLCTGPPAHGVIARANDHREVNLGWVKPKGGLNPGTTLKIDATPRGVTFDKTDVPASAPVNTFELNTGLSFSNEDAKKGNWVIGFGKSAYKTPSPGATFVPVPDMQYQITPVDRYVLAIGPAYTGQLVDVTMVFSSMLLLDFSDENSPTSLKVVHDKYGFLFIN